MNLVVNIYNAMAGAYLLLGVMHFILWLRNRRALANLTYVFITTGAAFHLYCELGAMTTSSPPEYLGYIRISHFGGTVVIIGSIIFIRLYLGAGRAALAWAAIGIRSTAFFLNFLVFGTGINYLAVESLKQIPFLGTQVSTADVVETNPWMLFSQLALIFWLLFVVEASVSCWKRGGPENRRKALTIGGSMALFIVLGSGYSVLVLHRIIDGPLLPALPFILTTFAMGYELSRDALRASKLSQDLQTSQRRLALAASATRLALWEWKTDQDAIWATPSARHLFGAPPDETLNISHFTATLHPDDRRRVMDVILKSSAEHTPFSAEYRRIAPGGRIRWITGLGNAELDRETGSTLLRGVSVDITEQKNAENALNEEREKLLHTTRLATISQMASFLAHELNQPLAAIVNNAGATLGVLESGRPGAHAQALEIIHDIIEDAQRAGEIIRGIRGQIRPGDGIRADMDPGEILPSVIRMITPEARLRGCQILEDIHPGIPRIEANSVQIQQVLLNLLLNALDAVTSPGAKEPLIIASVSRTDGKFIAITITDRGPGLPADNPSKVFSEFYTTKANGIGMGLVVSRTIAESHGGSLKAENIPGGGARFILTFPIRDESAAACES